MRRLLAVGVIAAVAALVPHLAMAGNQQVAEQIALSLEESGQLYGSNVGVRYQNGVVWLKGTVASTEQKQSAEKLVFHTPGVVRVINELTIAEDAVTQLQQSPGSLQPESHPQANPVWSARARELPVVTPAQSASPTFASAVQSNHGDIVVPASALEMERPRPTPLPPAPIVDLALPQPSPSAAPVMAVSTHLEQPQPLAQQHAMMAATAHDASQAMPMQMFEARQPVRMAYAAPLDQPTPAPGYAAQPQQFAAPVGNPISPAGYQQPTLPNYAWPTYAAYPNYGAVTYPKQYSPSAWPYIGPYYPYPQVPLGWRKVTMEWHDGWWYLDFNDGSSKNPLSGFFRPFRHK